MTVLLGTLVNAGGNNDGFGDGDTFGSQYTAVASGNLDTLKMVILASTFTAMKLAVYSDSSGVPLTLLGTSTAITTTTAGTQTASVSPTVSIASGTAYWLFLQPEGGAVNNTDTTPGSYRGQSLGAGVTTFPNPWASPGSDSIISSGGLPIQGEDNGTSAPASAPRTFNAIPFMGGVL